MMFINSLNLKNLLCRSRLLK